MLDTEDGMSDTASEYDLTESSYTSECEKIIIPEMTTEVIKTEQKIEKTPKIYHKFDMKQYEVQTVSSIHDIGDGLKHKYVIIRSIVSITITLNKSLSLNKYIIKNHRDNKNVYHKIDLQDSGAYVLKPGESITLIRSDGMWYIF